ncbi:UTRA domain-containing protein [Micromonospora sp. CPCC 205371]|nr:UTRA domain-containing protein [Micromonospora sp. CPCC 205371]
MNDAKWTSSSTAYIAPTSGDPWAREAAATGSRGTQRLVEVATVPAPTTVAAALGIPESSDVVVRRRLVLADDAPVELADSYYPGAIAAGTDLAEPRKIPGGAVTLLGSLGYVAADVDEEVSARQPSPSEQRALQLPDGEPVLILTRRSATTEGTPFEYSVMTMAARERRLRYQMKAP